MDADRAAAEGAGVATAAVVARAATLVEMVARHSSDWAEAAAVRGQADALRRRAERLAAANARQYAEALRAFEEHGDLGAALESAADVPLQIAETATDVAQLAAYAAERCDTRVNADAIAAGALAAGAANAAAEIVASNLIALEGDERVARARALASSASWALRP